MSLTPEQAAVTLNIDESKLVCALPGSGKTHTTVSLVENILKDPHSKTLMLTFTNAAAQEMQHRIEKRLGAQANGRVVAKTFAKAMLEQHRPLANGRRLILGGELQSYILRVMKKLGIDYSNLQLCEEKFDEFGRQLSWEATPGHKLDDAYVELQNMLAIYSRVDLNTVAREVVQALHSGKIKPLNFTHFVIDEFQDTDSLQYAWMQAHQKEGRYFTVVGDDDQSIYSWRGAVGYENMISFKRDFKSKAFLLSTCFRCAPRILGRAQKLIEHNEHRIEKDMQSAKTELGKVTSSVFTQGYVSPFTKLLSMRDDSEVISSNRTAELKNIEEYRFVVDQLQADYGSWTVLARTNLHLDNLERALSERGIPVLRLGGRSIFDTPNVIAIGKLLYGLTHSRHITPLIEGLAWTGECEEVLHGMLYSGQKHGFTALSSQKWTAITARLNEMCVTWAHEHQSERNASHVLNAFFTELFAWFEQIQPKDLKSRQGAMTLLQRILLAMPGSVIERAAKLMELTTKNTRKPEMNEREGKIILCTLTGSKGLEWPKVFIMNVNHEVIPAIKDEPDPEKKIAEERRLFYVGMTRAEDELVIHYHKDKPSMFIVELGTLLPRDMVGSSI